MLYLAAVYVGIYMVVGINPRRFIAASPSDTIGVSYRSHQVYFSKTVGVKVPSVTSLEKATILPSQMDGLDKERVRRSISHRTHICLLGLLTQTNIPGLSPRGILSNVDRISITMSWSSHFKGQIP